MYSHVSIPKTMQKLTRTSGTASEVIWQSLIADKNLRYLRFKNIFVPIELFVALVLQFSSILKWKITSSVSRLVEGLLHI